MIMMCCFISCSDFIQSHLAIIAFETGFSRIVGPCPDTMNVLQRLAIVRGLSNVDELLVGLGKQHYEVSTEEAFDLLRKEGGHKAVEDAFLAILYHPGKGYRHCNSLLEDYLKGMKGSERPGITAIRLRELKKYCGYTDDELHLLN